MTKVIVTFTTKNGQVNSKSSKMNNCKLYWKKTLLTYSKNRLEVDESTISRRSRAMGKIQKLAAFNAILIIKTNWSKFSLIEIYIFHNYRNAIILYILKETLKTPKYLHHSYLLRSRANHVGFWNYVRGRFVSLLRGRDWEGARSNDALGCTRLRPFSEHHADFGGRRIRRIQIMESVRLSVDSPVNLWSPYVAYVAWCCESPSRVFFCSMKCCALRVSDFSYVPSRDGGLLSPAKTAGKDSRSLTEWTRSIRRDGLADILWRFVKCQLPGCQDCDTCVVSTTVTRQIEVRHPPRSECKPVSIPPTLNVEVELS